MQEGSTRWETKENRKGEFGDYTVMGFKYENARGEIGWHITSWPRLGIPIHDFWVSGQNFHSVSIHYFFKGSPITLIKIFEPPITSGIEQDERAAVLKAIAEWEKPEAA